MRRLGAKWDPRRWRKAAAEQSPAAEPEVPAPMPDPGVEMAARIEAARSRLRTEIPAPEEEPPGDGGPAAADRA